MDGQTICMQLWDTAGQEDYARLRPMSYPETNIFLIAFAVNLRSSFENVTSIWYPEVHHACPSAQIILVGTKSDLRQEDDVSDKFVKSDEIDHLKQQINAYKYIECSSKTQTNLNDVFESSVTCYLNPPKDEEDTPDMKKFICLLI
ncbi:Ras-related protein ced-10 [Tritrichomonas foetus]|uniref:Ras-related protein ced-10 n=1 Tax=Tritrichomonas foetus TaxID=1144522 RepID=A0A1J4KCP3_9EUKA|nr:Ras-related protein ced-10 [Tritrichomonas foetus]|eukprot:OHT07468.1 Ras-related protein ced-10 [Tritrichomonas foetus]